MTEEPTADLDTAIAAALARAEQAVADCAGLLEDAGFDLEPASHTRLMEVLAPT